jgi:hypothetical protein
VNDADSVPNSAVMQIPPWLWGADPSAYFNEAQIHGQLIDHAERRWRVWTNEGWLRTPPHLVRVDHLAGPMQSVPRFDLLGKIAANDIPPIALDRPTVADLERLAERLKQTKTPVDAITYSQMLTMAVPSAQVADAVTSVYRNLVAMAVEGKPDHKVFPDAGVHVVRRAPELLHRIKLASVLLRVSSDERLRHGDLTTLHATAAAGETVFASAQGLYDGIFTFDAYIAPLLGALTPAIWGFSSHRMLGVILYSFGQQPLAGTLGEAAELLHVLPSQGTHESSRVPTLSADAASSGISWWIRQLNDLFSVLSEPVIFTNREGAYVPAKHLHGLLTVEQLFRRVHSILTAHRDANARRVLLFTVLDTLERLTGRHLPILCSLSFAKKTLAELRLRMPASAAELLLPGAERAVMALASLQNGFFILRHTGASDIEWTDQQGRIQRLSPELAAAQYIRVLRDATHGHGSNRTSRVEMTNVLLAHHDGNIPHDLALLGYLYLLDVMSRPADLRRTLHRQGRI